jgi:hypothetical protein
MIHSNEEQLNRRQMDKLNEKNEDMKYYEQNLIPQLQEMKEQKFQKEQERIMNIKKYKEDLDRQCLENKKNKLGIYNVNLYNNNNNIFN